MAGVCSKVVTNDLFSEDDNKQGEEEDLPGFYGADMSTKLKLLGCDVASFGVNQPHPDDKDVQNLMWNDPFTGIYRKLIFNKAGTMLRGGILIGDASDYEKLHKLAVSADHDNGPAPFPEGIIAAQLLAPPSARAPGSEEEEEADLSDPNAQSVPVTMLLSDNSRQLFMIWVPMRLPYQLSKNVPRPERDAVDANQPSSLS
jgi:hypothetical protein